MSRAGDLDALFDATIATIVDGLLAGSIPAPARAGGRRRRTTRP
jgi:hypothetical protein